MKKNHHEVAAKLKIQGPRLFGNIHKIALASVKLLVFNI